MHLTKERLFSPIVVAEISDRVTEDFPRPVAAKDILALESSVCLYPRVVLPPN